jgi:multicomponent Na+:H+ antiporter subunit E
MKTALISVVLGLLFWFGLNGRLETGVLISGIIVVAIAAAFPIKDAVFGDVKFSPRAFIAFIVWLIVFIGELIKSNIDVMLRVISPKVRINPAIVEVKTKLKTPLGRLALANSITLTPGTLTTDIKGDSLFIHWIDASSTDVEGATKAIVAKFEKQLEVVFG